MEVYWNDRKEFPQRSKLEARSPFMFLRDFHMRPSRGVVISTKGVYWVVHLQLGLDVDF
jgi:hypothetical protein